MRWKRPRFLAQDDLTPFIAKFGFPAFLLLGAALTAQLPRKPGSLVLAGLLALAGALQFYLCGLVYPDPECVWYRRFLCWQRIEYSEIAKCGMTLFPPGLGYLKLRWFVPPFGKLYFTFYTPGVWPWKELRLNREFLDFIRVRIGRPPGSVPEEPHAVEAEKIDDSLKARVRRCVSFGALTGGVILFARLFLNWPGPGFPPDIQSGQTWFYRLNLYLWHLCHRALDWPLNLALVLLFLAGMVAFRFRGAAPSLAAGIGALLGGLLARFFSGY